MSPKHPDFVQGDPRRVGDITDDYTHPGWNPTQAFTVIGLTAATIAALLTAQCTKTHTDDNSLQKQSQLEQIIPENSITQ